MAVATYTCSIFNNVPKAVHVGNQSVSGLIVHSGTIGDILFLCKVPHGATIVDFLESHTSGQTAATYSVGLDKGVVAGGAGQASCIILGTAGVIGATTQRFNAAAWPVASNWPPVVSLSDLDPVRYATVVAKATAGTFTISVSMRFTLVYRMDGPQRAGEET